MKLFHLQDTSTTTTSHQQKIKKKVLIEGGEIPQLTQYARAYLKPGQEVEDHAHQDMFEVFFVIGGQGELLVDGKRHHISQGSTFIIYPKEHHSLCNTGTTELVLQYFGVLT